MNAKVFGGYRDSDLFHLIQHQAQGLLGLVGRKPGLWTLDWTMDWTMDWIIRDSILDSIGQYSVLALPFKADHEARFPNEWRNGLTAGTRTSIYAAFNSKTGWLLSLSLLAQLIGKEFCIIHTQYKL